MQVAKMLATIFQVEFGGIMVLVVKKVAIKGTVCQYCLSM